MRITRQMGVTQKNYGIEEEVKEREHKEKEKRT
jgi:hypothetical protein